MKHYGQLDSVHNADEIRALPEDELPALCASVREFLVQSVSRTGGHLASNLGVVELSVALLRLFDPARDRVIYDVGHQSYVHKLFTGRRERFDTLRQYGGLCGFQKPEESPTDPCVTGHASNSISVALGMAHARTLTAQDYHVVAVIGDGAMTGGMAFEAMSNVGASAEPMLVVLNDNNMSIARNVGGMSRHLSRLRISAGYLRAKTRTKQGLERIPFGKPIIAAISHAKKSLKRLVLSTNIFEQMGFAYLGPVDGHNVRELCRVLKQAKSMKRPVLVHVLTCKGKGYALSERDPELYHGVSPFDPAKGIVLGAPKEDFSACFGNEACALAEQDERVCAITAAMPTGTGLSAFAARFPDRFFDVGIAEGHAAAMAGGLAAQGMVPLLAIYSTFLQRAYDQLIHDLAIARLHVVLCLDRAGVVGADGATHNGVFDIAYLRSIPGVTVLCPASFAELRSMLHRAVYKCSGVVAVRYPRGGQTDYTDERSEGVLCALRACPNAEVVILSYGTLVSVACQAAARLSDVGLATAVYKLNELSAHTPDAMREMLLAHPHALPVTIEEVVQSGCVGEWLGAVTGREVVMLNTGNRFLPHGSISELHKQCGLDVESVVRRVRREQGERGYAEKTSRSAAV